MPGFSQFKNFFHFNRGERRGLIILFCILISILFANIFMPYFIRNRQYDFSEFEETANRFLEQQAKLSDSIKNLDRREKKNQRSFSVLKPFPFDPNNLPEEQWLKMGLSKKQVKVIKNYEKKGGRFVTPDDLSKIYSISKREFQVLQPFINISESIEQKNQNFTTNEYTKTSDPDSNNRITTYAGSDTNSQKQSSGNQNPFSFQHTKKLATDWLNINQADTLDLMQLKGIGPAYAKRIIKYRNLLGGYARKEQLLEVYGMDTTRYHGFSSDIFIDTLEIRKINANTAGVKDLIAHPYIEYFVAKTIIRHRDKDGPFTSIEEIKERTGIPSEIFQKIRPYLCL